MNAIDNSNISGQTQAGYNKNFDYFGFVPVVNYTYNAGTKIIVCTDAGTYPSGNGFKNINVIVHDREGNQVTGRITAATGTTGNLDVSTLDPTKGLNITANVVCKGGLTADGRAWKITTAGGTLSKWSKRQDAAEAVNPTT